MYVVRGLFQNGVVSHEVSGSDPRVPWVQVDRCGVGCMAAVGASMQREERGTCQSTGKKLANCETTAKHIRIALDDTSCVFNKNLKRRSDFSRAMKLPFSTLGVGIV